VIFLIYCLKGHLHDSLKQVRDVLGGEDVSGLSDKDIQDTLWHYYFDVEQTVQWAIGQLFLPLMHRNSTLKFLSLEEQQRKRVARERKGKALVQVILIKAPSPFVSPHPLRSRLYVDLGICMRRCISFFCTQFYHSIRLT